MSCSSRLPRFAGHLIDGAEDCCPTVHVRIAQFFEEGFQRIGLPRLDEAAMVGASEVVDVVGGPFLVTSRPSLFVRYDLDSAFQRLGSVGMGVTLPVIKWSKASFISSSTLRHLRSATISQNGVAIRLVDCASVARCRKPLSVLVGTNRMLALVLADNPLVPLHFSNAGF